ncbi:hypothetical protein MCAP1_003101 [Malassezia caprae]|uniref:Mitochondrial import inner membrane translocase subunit TIM50 n=1 Tax=Malassezia caprae TaxID=1381934 RepID=A0AAF0E6Y5_9BASI|nr:hypothetical protein MCAP1_003101 [Malassezia caprae]
MGHPLLLVLDLNGTLLYRKKQSNGRSVPGGPVTPRPYLQALLRYCLGPYYDMKNGELAREWPEDLRDSVSLNYQPLGSQYWLRAPQAAWCPPPTPVQVLIWSSATKENVNRMVETMLPKPVQRGLLQRVWARETLVVPRLLGVKVDTTKDLSIAWDELNQWERYLFTRETPQSTPSFLSRARAEDRLIYFRQDRRTGERREKRKAVGADAPQPFKNVSDELIAETQFRLCDNGAHSSYGPLLTEPFGPHNTVLLDDSAKKAQCQPFNHICIPDYGKSQARRYREYTSGDPADVAEEELDDYLLQFVGVLDALEHVDDVAQWIQDGGAASFSDTQTPEERAQWVARGREALARRCIPVEP